MGMIFNLVIVSQDQVAKFKSGEDDTSKYLYDRVEKRGDDILDIEKSWHAIHYLLTGSAWQGEKPLAWVIMGGSEIGEDMGYGPAKLLDPEHVLQITAALTPISSEQLTKKYDVTSMQQEDIYAMGHDEEEDLEYITENYDVLKGFYQNAASKNAAILLFMT